MRDIYTYISQRGKSLPSRQQRDIAMPSLTSNTANQAEMSDDGRKPVILVKKGIRLIHLIRLLLSMTQSK